MLIGIDPLLVLASVLLAIQSAYVSLTFAKGIPEHSSDVRKLYLSISALALGLGIWCMHFVGMLALKFVASVQYSALQTLSSAFLCIIVVGVGFFFIGAGRRTLPRLAVAGLLVGAGIAVMHYLGMAALRTGCGIQNPLLGVALSAAIGVAAATLSLWLCFFRQPTHLLAPAIVMGLAISGMHYVAVIGADFTRTPVAIDVLSPAFSSESLSIVMACLGFLITSAFLLTLLPMSGPLASVARAPEAPAPWSERGLRPAPADRLSAPNLAFAGAGPIAMENERSAVAEVEDSPIAAPLRIPVSDNGGKALLPLQQVFAVQAYAHYTRIFDGERWRLCDSSISELEGRLPQDQFLRVHRSYIVNMSKVTGFKRAGDRGVLTLEGSQQETAPISRHKVPEVRRILGV